MRPISCNGWRTVVSGRPGGLGQIDVVEAGDRQVVRDAQASLGGCGHRADGGLVVESDQRGRPFRQSSSSPAAW